MAHQPHEQLLMGWIMGGMMTMTKGMGRRQWGGGDHTTGDDKRGDDDNREGEMMMNETTTTTMCKGRGMAR